MEEATQEVISESTEIKKLMGSEVPVLKQKDGTYLLGGKGGDIILFEENLTAPILQK